MTEKRPHIIILNPDEMRFDTMGHMGNPAAYTPALDHLAKEEGVSFARAYCQNPVCVPSRCSFLTGRYPHVHGHRTMHYLLHEGEETIFSQLKKAGYYVWMNGRNDLLAGQERMLFQYHADEIFEGISRHEKPEQKTIDLAPYIEKACKKNKRVTATVVEENKGREYSHYHGIVDKNPVEIDLLDTAAAIDRIRRIDELGDKPLCMFIGWQNPHVPYQVEQKYYDLIDDDKINVPLSPEDTTGKSLMINRLQEYANLDNWTDEQWRELRHVYLAQCAKVDHMISQVVEALKEAEIYDDSAIFVFSDHGDFAGDFHLPEKAQNSFEDILVRVPFLIKPPKGMKLDPGVAMGPVELIDFFATAMEWAHVEPDFDHFGKSLTEVVADRSKSVRKYAFCEGGRLPHEIQCDEWHAFGPNGGGPDGDYYAKVRSQLDPEAHEKGTMITDGSYKYVYRSSGRNELYDLNKDPQEKTNIYNPKDAELMKISSEMESEILRWYQQTCDTVPWEYDRRFSEERLWNIASTIVPGEYEDVVRTYIRETKADISEVIGFAFALRQQISQ